MTAARRGPQPLRRRALAWLGGPALARLVGAACALALAASAPAQTPPVPVAGLPFQVVVHADARLTSITRGELAALFMRNRSTLADGTAVQVIDAQDPLLREQFYQQVAGRNASQMHAYWSRIVFSGGGRPPPQSETGATLALLRRDATTIAYVPPGQDLRGLRLLAVLDSR